MEQNRKHQLRYPDYRQEPRRAESRRGRNSFIGGGCGNIIDSTGVATTFGVIGGGQNNFICAGTNFASIFNGNGNTVSGSYSSILGGSGNSDGGNSFIGMYGNGLTASVAPATYSTPSAFWADSLVTPNIPVDITGTTIYPLLPLGALYTNVPLGSGYLASQIFVK